METVEVLISDCQELGEKVRVEYVEDRGILGHETTLYETVRVDSRHYTFVKTLRMHNTKSEP